MQALPFGQLLRTLLLGLLLALPFGKLLLTLVFSLLLALPFGQLLLTLLFNLLLALPFGQLLRTLLFNLLLALPFGQPLRTLLLGLLQTLPFSLLLRTLLFSLLLALPFGQPLCTLLLRLLQALLLRQRLLAQLGSTATRRFILSRTRQRRVRRTLVRLVLTGRKVRPVALVLRRQALQLSGGLGLHCRFRLGPQAGVVGLALQRTLAFAFLGQAGARHPRAVLGRRVVVTRHVGPVRWRRILSRLDGRQRHLEPVVSMGVLGDHAGVESVRDVRHARLAAVPDDPAPRRRRGGCGRRYRLRRGRIDEREAGRPHRHAGSRRRR